MKKPARAAMGVIGACAACCAIPLAIPLISGLSVAGLASIDWDCLSIGGEVAAVGAGLAAAGLVGGGIWWHRRRKAAAQCAVPALASAGSNCGCSSNISKESA
jgi:high-affinity Fe2+/Pb2+ permease